MTTTGDQGQQLSSHCKNQQATDSTVGEEHVVNHKVEKSLVKEELREEKNRAKELSDVKAKDEINN